jgi:hypothetical protein
MWVMNEIGTAPGRGRQTIPAHDANRIVSNIAGEELHLPARAVMTQGPSTCPACGGSSVMWGCDRDQKRERDEIHPLVWHERAWMADSYICRECHAGWIEPDDPEPITWVRPYWIEPDV